MTGDAADITTTPGSSCVTRSATPAVLDLEEAWIIQRVKQGDLDAFETLYRRYERKVYGICLRIAANATVAEDLTQEVFLRVWQRIGQYESRSRFSTWLHRIAVNRALDGRRSELRRSARETAPPDADTWDPPVPARPPEPRMDLETAVSGLPLAARTVFVLHDIEGYRHDEIAELTGIATGTSKSQLHRARKLLRKRLES
jgi:RNA polymerase sigma-70 factor (ECF subfamily)